MDRRRHRHFLLISLPAQSHLNPTIQLGKVLARAGVTVTFATTVYGLNQLKTKSTTVDGIAYTSFSDGHDEDGHKARSNFAGYMDDLKRVGSQNLIKLLENLAGEGRPVTFIVYTVLLPWVAQVAREMHLPSAFFAIQCATALAVYHRFFNSSDGLLGGENEINESLSVELPGLPPLSSGEIPSFLMPANQYHSSVSPSFREHILTLEEDPNPTVLINTFDALEEDSIRAVRNMKIIAVGPLVPSAFSDGIDASDKSFGCDLFRNSGDQYLRWLDSKSESSVIYVSFGSIVVLEKPQKEEILNGLIDTGRPFLWVIRDTAGEEEETAVPENGLVVPWCTQVEVLAHSSTGCFVTHCGWNSTMESLVAGVPVVAMPQFADQLTSAKLVEEVWGNGVRARKSEEKGVVEREEIRRCVEVVVGEGVRGEDIRRNALKWRGLAMAAVREGGPSCKNLRDFLDSLG